MAKEGRKLTRRETVLALGGGAAVVVPGCAFLRGGAKHPIFQPPARLVSAEKLSVPAAQLASLAPGKVLRVDLPPGYLDILVTRSAEGGFHVVSRKCTHWGCTVGWDAAKQEWHCPCHDSRFSPDGKVLAGPADVPLRSPPARMRGDALVVDLGPLKKKG